MRAALLLVIIAAAIAIPTIIFCVGEALRYTPPNLPPPEDMPNRDRWGKR